MTEQAWRAAVELFCGGERARFPGDSVRAFLEEDTLVLDEGETVEYTNGSIWMAALPRTTGRKTHGWFFLRAWRGASLELTPEESTVLVDKVGGMAARWREFASDSATMAFHDETTAQRVMNVLVFLREHLSRVGSGETCAVLMDMLRDDVSWLRDDANHAGLNNHGMFQDIALLVYAASGLADDPEGIEHQAFTRLSAYFDVAFTVDGVHVENNPTYHVMVAKYVRAVDAFAEAIGRQDFSTKYHEFLERMDLFAAHMVTPAGTFPPISDTKVVRLTSASAHALVPNGKYVGAVSKGTEGTLPETRSFVAQESGYAIARSGWQAPTDAFLLFSAAYNADYHKHSDELSLYFMDAGVEILREAGPNGYQYDDPFTKYAFSSMSHNTVLVDGAGLPRTDDLAHTTRMAVVADTPDEFCVVGSTQRYSGVHWDRRVTSRVSGPTGGCLVEDTLEADDERLFTFLWHLGPEVEAVVRGSCAEIFTRHSGVKVAELSWQGSPVEGVRCVTGRSHPTVQGWCFPEMGVKAPAACIEIDVRATRAVMEWDLRTARFHVVDRGVVPQNPEWQVFWGEKPVHYRVEGIDPKTPPRQLAIVFSDIGQPWDFTFNYRRSLESFEGATLYVLDDFGDQGSYYLGNGRDLAEFRSVQALLREEVTRLGVPLERVSMFGSSEGGTAALMHGVSLGVGHVYVGGPQFHVGSFIAKVHPNILRYVAGGEQPCDIAWLDQMPRRVLRSGLRSTRISVVVGAADWHHKAHVVSLVDEARALGYAVRLHVVPGTPHSDLGAVMSRFIHSWVSAVNGSVQGGDSGVLPHVVAADAQKGIVGLSVEAPDGARVRAKLVGPGASGEVVEVPVKGLALPVNSGRFRFRVYVIFRSGERIAFGTEAVVL